jgi:hypothetical protein
MYRFPPTPYLGSVVWLVIELAIIRPSGGKRCARQGGATTLCPANVSKVFRPSGGTNAVAGFWRTCEDAQDLLREFMKLAGPLAVR